MDRLARQTQRLMLGGTMDIVDAQVHANVLGTEVTLAVMDALGIQGVLFDEYQTTAEDGATQPG
jgi:hypothetical protein